MFSSPSQSRTASMSHLPDDGRTQSDVGLHSNSACLKRQVSKLFAAGVFCLLSFPAVVTAQQFCTYQTFTWDTLQKKSVDWTRVEKPRGLLTEAEVDAYTGCSVCEQDQRRIAIPPLAPFRVCHLLAPRLERVLRRLLQDGEPIVEIIGYRVGKTRGGVDAAGLRTEFSNHAYGVAIDVNPDSNGLYDNCIEFGPGCRLIRGGTWDPRQAGSLRADGAIVSGLESIGLMWGGEIDGWQKDFMHFSITGY